MAERNHIDVWSIAAVMDDGFILTSYGITDEAKAREVGRRILESGLATKVELNHITKKTPRSRWSSSKAVLRNVG